MAQRVVVVEIFITGSQPMDALARLTPARKFNALWVTRIAQCLGHTQAPVGLAQVGDAPLLVTSPRCGNGR